jgi:hypothetical protein
MSFIIFALSAGNLLLVPVELNIRLDQSEEDEPPGFVYVNEVVADAPDLP